MKLPFLKRFLADDAKNHAKLYVSTSFSVQQLQSFIDSFYEKKCSYTATSKGFSVDLDVETDAEKNQVTKTRWQFIQNDTIVYVTAEQVTIDLSSYEEMEKAVDFDIRKHALFTYLQAELLKLQDDQLYALQNTEQLTFISHVETETQNYIFHQLENEECVFAILGVSEVVAAKDKKSSWYFVVTSQRQFLIEKSPELNFKTHVLKSEHFTIQEKTGKDIISGKHLSFYTEFMNDYLYRELLPIVKNTSNRFALFGDLIVKKYAKKETHLALASRIFKLQSKTHEESLNLLKSALIVHLRKLVVTEENREILFELFRTHANSDENFGENLAQIADDWRLPFKTQQIFVEILRPLQRKETATQTIAFHEYVYHQFIQQKKKDTELFEFRLNYAKHLTNAKRFSDALSLYESIYIQLPDDSITDLLPTETTNLLVGEGGQQLKITILEAILHIQKQLQIDTAATVHSLAELQPFVDKRIDALLSVDAYAEKAKIVKEVLHAHEFEIAKTNTVETYETLEKEAVFLKVVPDCFKDAKGFFDTLTNFIAAINPPDYQAVISFSDMLSEENYPVIISRINNMCHALQMDVPECYIGRGNYANKVIGVEGKPSFILVGVDYLLPESSRNLESKSLLFLIGIELAHMYFEHSKITASDVWRGAADKGFSVVSMLLTVLPFVGNIGRIFGNIASVERYGRIINRVEQVANVADKSKDIVEVSEKFNLNPFKKAKSQADDSQNLLITSRLMEIVADKVALLFIDDLEAAVKGLVFSKPNFEENYNFISKHGLDVFLAKTNEAGEFIHQDLSIRIKNLCSFYLSDSFEELKATLHGNA